MSIELELRLEGPDTNEKTLVALMKELDRARDKTTLQRQIML